jgi:hypothetical protein
VDARETASDRDRAYFATHPGVTVYVRRRLPGEFGLAEMRHPHPDLTHVEVEQVAPGFRLRRAIRLLDRHSYPTGEIPWEHAEAVIDAAVAHGGTWRLIADDELDEGVGVGESA